MVHIARFACPSPSPASSISSMSEPPAPPVEPGPEECCQRGCKVCVWDVYRDKLDEWTAYMQQHHPSLLQPQSKGTPQRQMYDASMDAFAALERQLQQQEQPQPQQQQQLQLPQHPEPQQAAQAMQTD